MRRRGLPLATKLALATGLLLAVAVATAAYSGLQAMSTVSDRSLAERRSEGEQAIEREATLTARHVAALVALPLANGNFADLEQILENAREQNARIAWIEVTDLQTGAVAAASGPVPPAPDGGVTVPVVLGETIGRVRLSVSTDAQEASLEAAVASAAAESDGAVREQVRVAALVLLIGVLLAALAGTSLARPLRDLSTQAARIARGDLGERVRAHRRDEIGDLARDFNHMADQIGRLLDERASQAQAAHELELARQVHAAMLPAESGQRAAGVEITGTCRPTSSCGGDFWSWHALPGDRLLVVVGDATGHGLHSALVAAVARGAVDGLASTAGEALTPVQALAAIDAALRGHGQHGINVTAFAALFDARRATLSYANAGHNFPLLVRGDAGGTRAVAAEVLAGSGNPLGAGGGEFRAPAAEVPLAAGDTLALYTDGLVDATRPGGRRYGEKRLRQWLLSRRVDAADSSEGLGALVQLRGALLADLEAFMDGEPADDDVTLVLCRYAGVAARASARGSSPPPERPVPVLVPYRRSTSRP